jgi:multicomponent Na+:H+ antiporter subunit D
MSSLPAASFVLTDHLAVLPVAVPLIASGIVALLPNGRIAWAFTTAVSLVVAICAVLLLFHVQDTGTVSYAIGGWPPPIGIEYRIDMLNAFVLTLVAMIGVVIMPFALKSVPVDVPEDKQPWFYACFLLCLTGLLGMTVSGDAFNVFVFMEISSLATYIMIAMGRDKRALLSAYQYLIMGTIGATFYVLGVGLLYVVSGSLNFADMSTRLGEAFATNPRPVMAALAFIVVGLSLKLALFPLHVWLPNAYAFAPPFATVFLAATATKVSVYVLLRVYFTLFGTAIDISVIPVTEALLVLALAAMFVASVLAFYENRVERMLAYSSVAQIGYIMLGISLANVAGMTGGIVHILNHAVTKALLFLTVGAVVYRIGHLRIEQLAGLGKQMPLTMAAFVIGGLSIIGVPGTAGFITKWNLAVGSVEAGHPILVFMIVASSILATLYIGKVIEVAYFRPISPDCAHARDPGLSMMLPIAIMTGAVIYFGIDPTYGSAIAQQAAEGLLKGLRP